MNVRWSVNEVISNLVHYSSGLGEEGDALDWSSNNHGRNLVSGGMFSEFLMTPSERFIFVIDGRRRHVQCKWNNVMKANIIIPLNNYNSNAV